jgi:hypothetical protein
MRSGALRLRVGFLLVALSVTGLACERPPWRKYTWGLQGPDGALEVISRRHQGEFQVLLQRASSEHWGEVDWTSVVWRSPLAPPTYVFWIDSDRIEIVIHGEQSLGHFAGQIAGPDGEPLHVEVRRLAGTDKAIVLGVSPERVPGAPEVAP